MVARNQATTAAHDIWGNFSRSRWYFRQRKVLEACKMAQVKKNEIKSVNHHFPLATCEKFLRCCYLSLLAVKHVKAALECNRQEACQINGLFVHDLTQLRCLWWGGRRGSRLLKLGKMPVANVTVSPVALAKSKTSLKCRCVESSPRNSSASALFCSQLLLRGFLH